MRGRGRTLLLGAAMLPLAGCGFLTDLAEPDPPPSIPVASGEPARPAAGPVVVVDGRVGHGRLTVTLGEVRTGVVPPVPNFSDSCPVEPATLQFLPVEFEFRGDGSVLPGLAARLDVGRGPATPADIGDVGIVVESGDGAEPYCFDYPPLPTSDRFWNQMGAATITGYVVLDRAITPATPDGRPDVFRTLVLRISELRSFLDPVDVETLDLGDLSVGRPCPDDPEAICVLLG